jgi:hypothetical protein
MAELRNQARSRMLPVVLLVMSWGSYIYGWPSKFQFVF